MKLSDVTERIWMGQVREIAKVLGWLVYHTYSSKRSPHGFPDVVLVRPPRVIFAELKRESGKLTIEQETWAEELSQCPGVEYYLWRPSQLQDVGDALSR